jgi:ParB-like chromosome segregation protein Spo0J
VTVFGERTAQVSEDVQVDFVENFLIEPRLKELNSAWQRLTLPGIRQDLSDIATSLEEVALKERAWTADYEEIAADLKRARAELSGFDFSGSLRRGDRPWWRTVEGKEGYKSFELDRVDQVMGAPKVLDDALARLVALESARQRELEDIEQRIVELKEQLKATANLLGSGVDAGAYVSLSFVSIAPTLPLVLGVLFAVLLAESSEQRRRFVSQLKAYAPSSADDLPVLRTIISEHQGATILLAGALAGAWILHAAYEAYRLVPESLATTGFSTGGGLALQLVVVVFASLKRGHEEL